MLIMLGTLTLENLLLGMYSVFGGAMSWMANLQSVVDSSPVAVMPFDFGLDGCYQQNL